VSPEEQAKRDADRKRRQEEEERMCAIVRQEMPPPFTLGQVRSSESRRTDDGVSVANEFVCPTIRD
jgi:hypothetical protein